MTANRKPAASPDGEGMEHMDLGAELAAMMIEALRTAAPQAPERAPREADPWAGVQLTPVQTEALIRAGWHQTGWRESRDGQRVKAAHMWKAGPREIKLANLGQHPKEEQARIVASYQFWALTCARLAQYGRVHVGDVAIVSDTLGVLIESSSAMVTQLKSKLGGQEISKTADGFIVCNLQMKQRMHDAYVMMWDKIMQAKKGSAKKATA